MMSSRCVARDSNGCCGKPKSTFGVFLKPVTEDLGISRGALSSGLGISAWFVALSCPIVGWLIDRFGTRRVMVPGVLLFALAVASFGFMQAQPVFLIYAIFCIAGFISECRRQSHMPR
jgi:MFS family permease